MSSQRAVKLLAALAVGATLAACSHPAKPASPASAAASPSTGTAVVSPTAEPSPSKAADIADCTWHEESQPTKFTVPARDITQPILSMGLENGNVPAPPHDQRYSVAWWNAGPRVGSGQGHVILTAHTWTGGEALGNVLADPDHGLHPGDVIKVADDTGPVCYRFTHMEVIDVASYDPHSTVWINPNGTPQLTIMICWDPNPATGEWRQRHVFFADAILP